MKGELREYMYMYSLSFSKEVHTRTIFDTMRFVYYEYIKREVKRRHICGPGGNVGVGVI